MCLGDVRGAVCVDCSLGSFFFSCATSKPGRPHFRNPNGQAEGSRALGCCRRSADPLYHRREPSW